MKKLILLLQVTLFIAAIASPIFAEGQKEEEGGLRFGFVCRKLTHPWYVEVEKGIKARCAELGIDYLVVDANLSDEAFMKAVDSVIEEGIDGLMVVVTQQSLGPVIADKCREVGIPVTSVDITINDSRGKQIPYVGIPAGETGEMGGHALAKLAKERGFFKPGNVVKVMQIDMSFLSVVREMTMGYQRALMQDLPLKKEDFIVQESKTGMFEENLQVATSILNAHPEVTHWIVPGINEDGAIAPLRVFEKKGFPLERVLACGVGGSIISYEEFQKPHKSYIAIKLEPFKEGEAAVQILYDYVIEGTQMPLNTLIPGVIVTKDNYKDFKFTF